MNQNEIITQDSDLAAKFINVKGWISRLGRFFGNDEKAARYDGCTHLNCSICGDPYLKNGRSVCDKCHKENEVQKYLKLPVIQWDGDSIVYSISEDCYFNCLDDVEIFLQDNPEISTNDLLLVKCKQKPFQTISLENYAEEYFEDLDLGIDDLPNEIVDAIEDLNKIIGQYAGIIYQPDDIAIVLKI